MAEVRMLSDLPADTGVLRRMTSLLPGHVSLFLVTVVVNLGAAAARVAGFALVGVVADAVLDRDPSRVWLGAGTLGAVVAATFVLDLASRYLVVRLGEGVVRDLREHALALVATAPLRFVEAHRGGELVRRLTGEIAALSQFVGGTLPALVNSALIVVLTLVMLAGYSWPLTVALMVLGAAGVVAPVRGYLSRAPTAYAGVAAAEAQVSARFSETLPAHEQIRALGARQRRLRTFAADNRRLLDARVQEVRAEVWLLALGPVGGLGVVALVALAATGADRGWLSVGGAVVFLLAARSAFGDVQDLVGHVGDLRAARVHLARVLDLVDATTPVDGDRRTGVAATRGALVAEQVGYSYGPGSRALAGIDLEVHPGERVAVVGPTGSGKTTLGKVLAGLYEPDEGRVLIDGRPLGQLDAGLLRRGVVLIPQEVLLVSGTVADNLAMVPNVFRDEDSRAAMRSAATALGLEEWLLSLPEGLDTPVGDHGSRISAGERQLVALLRAALVDPAVLVLDEATADVDPVTAAQVEDALARATRDRVVVVIAHRPDTIDRADHRVELVAGRLRD